MASSLTTMLGELLAKKVGVPIWKSKNHPARDGFLLDG